MIKRFFLKILTALTCLCLVANIIPTFNNTAIAATDNDISESENTTFYYIDTNGNNNNDGSFTAPLKDLYGLKDKLISDIKNNSISTPNIEIVINEGDYFMDHSFKLTNKDLLYKSFNISFVGIGKVNITGGVTLDNSKFSKISKNDKEYYVYDLSSSDLNFDYSSDSYFKAPALYSDNSPMNIARYPNDNFATIGDISGTKNDNPSFKIDTNDFILDSTDEHVYLSGYLFVPWECNNINIPIKNNVATINKKLNMDLLSTAPYYIYNSIKLLDTNNEYYIDYDNKLLYLSNISDISKTYTLSLTKEPLIDIYYLKNISIENINFNYCRDYTLRFTSCSSIELKNNSIFNCSSTAIDYDGVTNSSIKNCTIYNTGRSAFFIRGGDRLTLTSSNNVISGNNISNTSILQRTSTPSINIEGVGATISDNEIYDIPSLAIEFKGNNHLFENNNIYNVCYEASDAGAIYTGNDWTYRGNVIKGNNIHDMINSISNVQIVGIYLDNCTSGTDVFNNKLTNINTGILCGGGRDNTIYNNTIDSCTRSLVFDDRAYEDYWYLFNTGQLEYNLSVIPYNNKLWSTAYPEMQSLNTIDHNIPYNNSIYGNTLINTSKMDIYDIVRQYGNIQN